MDEKEKAAQRALGTLKKYIVTISAAVDAYVEADLQIEATSEEEAKEMAQEIIDDQPHEIDWEFEQSEEVDENSITIEGVKEE